ncbi:MAG: rRNA (guanine527-N7)-methyltransferase [Acidimicrobiaceae bacterium]|nr:rRNA (guanine527-N7)-methyltransferase [Acidimicrobiaceae bacterium]
MDLGSGGGVPGLVLAELWPQAHAVLLDSMERRTSFLTDVVGELGWRGRVTVVRERAEVFGRVPDRRAAFDLVVARGFGPPSVTAECAAPLLRLGGRLVVSEPPEDDPGRWPAQPLSELGLRSLGLVEDGARFHVLEQVELCSDAYPRRVGLPAKRPLWLCST